MRRRRPHEPERRLLVRARRRITAQVAGAISVMFALVGVMVYCVITGDQDASARRDLAVAAQRALLSRPPPCVWLFELRGGTVLRSPGAPAVLPVRAALQRAAAGHEPGVGRIEIAGQSYLVRTQWRGGVVVQAVMNLHFQVAERHRLLRALAAAEVAGLMAALVVGRLVARGAIAPLGEALMRRRLFAADVSHELRTPLTRLHVRAQIVARGLRRGNDPLLVADEVDRLVNGTRHLGDVVEDLLLSVQFGQLRRPFGPVDLAALAEELVVAEAARAEALGVTIEVRRQGPGGHVVCGAQSALLRVISALLDNALAHTRAGGHIRVVLSGGPGTVRLDVRDDGVGLDPRDAERLFSRFVGGARSGGLGLGLALVREVVDGHGGTVTADGRPGAGAVFTVLLPADPAGAARPDGIRGPGQGLTGTARARAARGTKTGEAHARLGDPNGT
ncbi:sensor histidine kinase [Streptosporangium sp. DT93]|uniref:sensor histidine kinase n=1 Tax=Streptosporangium sp. DT93 TaxID=3393428 RepID=UPI003CF924A3